MLAQLLPPRADIDYRGRRLAQVALNLVAVIVTGRVLSLWHRERRNPGA